MRPETLVLVHIAAPSKAADDAQYRRLAQAYQDFEPASRVNVVAREPDEPAAALIDLSSLLNLSFQSVWEERPPANADGQSANIQAWPRAESYCDNVSPSPVIPDSQPDALPKITRRRLSLDSSFGSMGDSAMAGTQEDPTSDSGVSATFGEASPDLSTLPHIALSDHMSCSSPELPEHIPSSLPEECGQLIQGTERVTAAPCTPRAKRHRSPELGSSPPTIAFKRTRTSTSTAADVIPMTLPAAADSFQRTLVLPSSSPAPEPVRTSLCILPPQPPVASVHLDAAALVTGRLAKLARDLGLERRYQPVLQPPGRVLQPFERGFWRLSTADWPTMLRHSAWAFLDGYVRSGDAGWGVWCSRDAAPHTWLRLHCFAAVARHTYLLLYVVSKRHILGTGATWVDASGTAALVVHPKRAGEEGGRMGLSCGRGTDSTQAQPIDS